MRLLFITNKPFVDCETFVKNQINAFPTAYHYYFVHGFLRNAKGRGSGIGLFLRLYKKLGLLPHYYNLIQMRMLKPKAVLSQYGMIGVQVQSILPNKSAHIVHFHGHDVVRKTILNKYRRAYKEMFTGTYGIISVSRVMSEKLIELGVKEDQILLNPCGPSELFENCKPEFKSNQFTFVGRLVEKKAPQLLILAFNEVVKEMSNAKLVIVGDGPLLDSCISLVSALSLTEHVEFAGRLSSDGIKEIFESSIAYVQHSITAPDGDMEGTPVSILEASLSGLPVISTRHAGIQDVIVDNETGCLVDELDYQDMAQKMKMLLKDKTLAEKYGEAGRKRIKGNYSLKIHLDKFRILFDSIS